MMTKYAFVSHIVHGPEAMVRNLFGNRELKGSAAARIFPGVRQVAILPTLFDDASAAEAYLAPLLEKGGNAAAVRVGPESWYIGAWVSGAWVSDAWVSDANA